MKLSPDQLLQNATGDERATTDKGLAVVSVRDGQIKLVPNMAQDVADFHYKYGIQYEGPCRHLPAELYTFRLLRLKEELEEYNKAFDESCLEGSLDALVDLIYIALGNAHLHGFTPEKFNEAWRRVHVANMAKELSHPGNPGKYGKLGDKRDIVKPPGWKAPDHSDLVK